MALKAGSNIVRRSIREWQEYCDKIQASSGVQFGEKPEVRQERIKKALKDYDFFARTYFALLCPKPCAEFHIKAANKIKETYEQSKNLHAALEWPRDHAKSVHSDIIIPAWLNAHDLLTGMILVGKNGDDACNLLSDVQAQLQYNQLYIHDFGDQYNLGSWEVGDFTTRKGIRFLAIGRDQSPRGARKNEKRPNYAVADDIDDDEIVFNQRRVRRIVDRLLGALWFALRTESAVLVMAGNRIHPQSILAHFVGDTKPGAPKRKGIYHSKIFAIDPKTNKPAWPERYTTQMILDKMAQAGTIIGRREFFHENAVEGTIFKDSMIHWKPMPKTSWRRYTVIIGYFDPSYEATAKSDFKAIRVWGLLGNEKHCLKSFVQRTELHKCWEFMSMMDDETPMGVGIIWYIEKQFITTPIRNSLNEHNLNRVREGKRPLAVIQDTRDKENKYTRIVRMEPDYTNGHVYYNIAEMHNGDMQEGNNQLKGIEPGYNSPDDSPDADEGAFHYLNMHLPGSDFPPIIGRNRRNSSW
jgi:hypothetical protein